MRNYGDLLLSNYRLNPGEKQLAKEFFPREILVNNIQTALGEAFIGKKVLIRLTNQRLIHCMSVIQGTELWIDEIDVRKKIHQRTGVHNDPGYGVFAALVYAAKLMNLSSISFDVGEKYEDIEDIYIADEMIVRCLKNLWIDKVRKINLEEFQVINKNLRSINSGCVSYIEIENDCLKLFSIDSKDVICFKREEIPILIKSFEYFYGKFPNLPDAFRYIFDRIIIA